MNDGERAGADRSRGFSGLQVAGIALLCVLASALLTVWAVRVYLYPSEFEPVALSASEQGALDAKLARLEGTGGFERPAFAAGVAQLAVEEGRLKIKLRE
jgi:hypothetical protein